MDLVERIKTDQSEQYSRSMAKPFGTIRRMPCPKCREASAELDRYIDGSDVLAYKCPVCRYFMGVEFPADTTDEEYEAAGWFEVHKTTATGTVTEGRVEGINATLA